MRDAIGKKKKEGNEWNVDGRKERDRGNKWGKRRVNGKFNGKESTIRTGNIEDSKGL